MSSLAEVEEVEVAHLAVVGERHSLRGAELDRFEGTPREVPLEQLGWRQGCAGRRRRREAGGA